MFRDEWGNCYCLIWICKEEIKKINWYGERVWICKKKWFLVLLVSLFMKLYRVYGWLKFYVFMWLLVLLVSLFMKVN